MKNLQNVLKRKNHGKVKIVKTLLIRNSKDLKKRNKMVESIIEEISRNIYVDFENVQSMGLCGMDKLKEKDSVFLFYSKNADNIKIDICEQFVKSSAKIQFIEVETLGIKNGLDFQLIATLFLDLNKKEEHYIVSKDNGFDMATIVGKRKGYAIHRVPSIKEMLDEGDRTLLDEKNEKLRKSLEQFLYEELEEAELSGKTIDVLVQGLNRTCNKNQLYHYLTNELGQDVGAEVYRLAKQDYEVLTDMVYKMIL